MLDLGDTTTLMLTVTRDDTGALANATSVVLTLTLPDGTTATPSVTNASTGIYTAPYTWQQAGRYAARWVSTGTVPGTAGVYTETFEVAGTPDVAFISAEEAVTFMRAEDLTGPEVEILRGFARTACAAIEGDLGIAVARQTLTVDFDYDEACYGVLVLPRVPLGQKPSITTVTAGATTLATGTFTASRFGILRLQSRPSLAFGEGLTVTYTAGFADIPEVLRFAALGEVMRYWQATQQMPHTRLDDFDAETALAVATGASRTRTLIGAYEALRPPRIA